MYEQSLIAVDVPPSLNYKDVREYLNKQFSSNIFDFKESCLSDTHRANL